MTSPSLAMRAARHMAMADPVRLAILDDLARSDRAPIEIRQRFGLESNLLAHHLDVLERAGLVERSRSSGDGRRRYVHLLRDGLDELLPGRGEQAAPALFVCTRNSARSQLAAALWRSVVASPAESAGTQPATRVHPGAVAAARRAGLDLAGQRPRRLADIRRLPALVVTVCDQAHESLGAPEGWLHWSIPDPVGDGSPGAFDRTVAELRQRMQPYITAGVMA